MFKVMENTPNDVIGFEAVGRITGEDYSGVLIPRIKSELKRHEKARVVLRFGPEFTGYTAKAVLDDTIFGLTHVGDFDRLAVVTDVGWIRQAVQIFAPLLPNQTRVYPLGKEKVALAWAGHSNETPSKN